MIGTPKSPMDDLSLRGPSCEQLFPSLYGNLTGTEFYVECRTSHYGNDLPIFPNIESLDRCASLCHENNDCYVWVWRTEPADGQGTCFLKGNESYTNNFWVSNHATGYKPSTNALARRGGENCLRHAAKYGEYGNFYLQCGTNRPGFDIKVFPEKSFEKCLEACDKAVECRVAAWQRSDPTDQAGTCFFKTGEGPPTQDSKVDIAVKFDPENKVPLVSTITKTVTVTEDCSAATVTPDCPCCVTNYV